MSEPKENDVTIPNWLKAIGDARDSLVVLSAVIYILGYIVWSIYAWQNDLGLLPVLDSQYLIAGVFPFFLLLELIITILIYSKKIQIIISPSAKKTIDVIASGLLFLACVFLLLYVFTYQQYGFWLIGGSFLLLTSFLFLGLSHPEITRGLKSRYQLIIAGVILMGFLVFIYIQVLFPSVPQSLGGPRPRCAHLEIEWGALSLEAWDILLEADDNPIIVNQEQNTTEKIIRTDKLDVLLVSNASLLVRKAGASGQVRPQAQQEGGILEIKQDLIKAIQWCD